MAEKRNTDPGNRMRKILYDSEEDSPLSRLPRATGQPATPTPPVTPPPTTTHASTLQPAARSAPPKRTWVFGPPFWTITGCLSLIVNVVLIVILLSAWPFLGVLQSTAGGIGSGIIGGLYSNFEKMDRATIRTTIPVRANVPLNITVPVQTTTRITLAEAAEIPNARVVINTGSVNINSNASVTLPAGTPLTVTLNFALPVQDTIPVEIDVPVEIPMNATELHEPFVGLQDVIRPLYCFIKSDATNLDGQQICK